MFIGGLAVFTVASAICGFAPTADPADRRPRPPGRRRGGRHAGVAGARPAGHAARAGADRRRHLGVDGRPRRGDRTDDRWAARRLGRLAVGLLRQHPGVRAGRGGGPADARRVEGVRPRPVPGPGRIGPAGCRRRCRLPGARAERRLGVGRPAHDRRPRGRGRARRRLRRPLAPSAGTGPRPLAVPHPELPVGERGDRRVRPLVHGDVPGQRHVPDLGLAVRHRQGRAGDVAGTDRRARAGPPVRDVGRPHRGTAADHHRRARLLLRRPAADPAGHADVRVGLVDAAGIPDHRARRGADPAAAVQRDRAGAADRPLRARARPSTRRCASSAPRSGLRSSSRSSPAQPPPTCSAGSSGLGGCSSCADSSPARSRCCCHDRLAFRRGSPPRRPSRARRPSHR